MDYRKIRAVFFIIVFLLLLALIVHWAVGLDDSRRAAQQEPEPEPTEEVTPPVQETPAPTPIPAQQRPTAPTPKPDTPPAATPKPAQQPAPTPKPTEPPAPAGKELGSGQFRSDTGTGLNLMCEWRAVSVEGNKAEITLTVGIRSASIYLNEWVDCIGLRVGDKTGSMTQPALSYEGGDTGHTFGSKTFTVDLSGGSSFSVAVEWHYNGDYGGTHFDVIECGGTISLN